MLLCSYVRSLQKRGKCTRWRNSERIAYTCEKINNEETPPVDIYYCPLYAVSEPMPLAVRKCDNTGQ